MWAPQPHELGPCLVYPLRIVPSKPQAASGGVTTNYFEASELQVRFEHVEMRAVVPPEEENTKTSRETQI